MKKQVKNSLLELLNSHNKQNRFVHLKVLSQDELYNLSYGEVKNSNTIDYKFLLPVTSGLHAQEVFGPIKSNVCLCNKVYRKVNTICNDCGVEITNSIVRRYRLGYIKLNTPIVNTIFYNNTYSVISYILNIKYNDLLNIINFKKFIVINSDNSSNFIQFSVLDEENVLKTIGNIDFIIYKNPSNNLEIGSGSDAILQCLRKINIVKELNNLLSKYTNNNNVIINNSYDLKRASILRDFIENDIDPKKMIFDKYFPILPAGLRPIVRLKKIGEGLFGGVDLDKHYKMIINRNNRLSKIINESSSLMIKWSKKLIQVSCDYLFDNRRLNEYRRKKDLKITKSLLENIIGKQGFLRLNILGKRIDYSARTVIVVDADLKINQVGLPMDLAISLFEPYLIERMIHNFPDKNVFEIIDLVKKKDKQVYETLTKLVKGRTVLMNRAPTLHKYSIQSFDIILTDDDVIHLNPLVCSGFNADFDGDQFMTASLLDPRSEVESQILMKSSRNLFLSTTGDILFFPNREMILGLYWMSIIDNKIKNDYSNRFYDEKDILLLLDNNLIHPQQEINFLYENKVILTTPGRVIVNSLIPKEFRNYDIIFDGNFIKNIIYSIYNKYNIKYTLNFLDDIKKISFKYATFSGLSLGMFDFIEINDDKKELIKQGNLFAKKFLGQFTNKLISKKEFHLFTNYKWLNIFEKLRKKLLNKLSKDKNNFLYLSLKSGARASLDQIFQICVLKGLFIDSNNNIINLPVLNSLREGLNSFQFFVSATGARKGTIDKALKTGVSGYLSRKESILLSEKIIDSYDCNTKKFMTEIINNKTSFDYFKSLLLGRYIVDDVIIDDVIVVNKDKYLNLNLMNQLFAKLTETKLNVSVKYRSILVCELKQNYYCVKCFGLDLSTFKEVCLGEVVGINSAQSLGEPSTQLTLRTFHKGGIARKFSEMYNSVKNNINCYLEYDINKCVKVNDYFLVIYNLLNLTILDENKKIVKRITLKSGSQIFYKNNVLIEKNNNICNINKITSFYAYDNGTIVLDNVLLVPIKDKVTKVVNYLVKKNPLNYFKDIKMLLVDKQNNIIHTYRLQEEDVLFIDNFTKVKKGQLLGKDLRLETKKHDITGGLPKVQNLLENIIIKGKNDFIIMPYNGAIFFDKENFFYLIKMSKKEFLENNNLKFFDVLNKFKKYIKFSLKNKNLNVNKNSFLELGYIIQNGELNIDLLLEKQYDLMFVKELLCNSIYNVYINFGICISRKHIELLINSLFSYCVITYVPNKLKNKFFIKEVVLIDTIEEINKNIDDKIKYKIIFKGISASIYDNDNNFLNSISYQHTIKNLIKYVSKNQINKLDGVMKNYIMNNDIRAGTSYLDFLDKENRQEILNQFILKLKEIFIKYNSYSFDNIINVDKYYINFIEDCNNKYFLVYILNIIYDEFISKECDKNIFNVINDKNIVVFLFKKLIIYMLSQNI